MPKIPKQSKDVNDNPHSQNLTLTEILKLQGDSRLLIYLPKILERTKSKLVEKEEYWFLRSGAPPVSDSSRNGNYLANNSAE